MELVGNILAWIAVGIVAGGLARLLVPGRDPMGCLGTMLLGMAGALVGGIVWALAFGGNIRDRIDGAGIFLSTIGAIIVLLIGRMFRRPADPAHKH